MTDTGHTTAASPPDARPPAALCRIFLVEENGEDRLSETHMLEGSGFVDSVRCFPDCRALLRYMKQEGFYDRSVMCLTPTLIIIGLGATGGDELWAIERLKSDAFLHGIPLLALAGQHEVHPAVMVLADGVIPRPLDPHFVRRHTHHAWQWPLPEMWMS